jgi:hypothetical protein
MDHPKSQEAPVADDLLLGAGPIAEFLYGDPSKRRDVYRNPAGLTFFRHGSAIAAFKSTLRTELADQERAARETLRQERIKSAGR